VLNRHLAKQFGGHLAGNYARRANSQREIFTFLIVKLTFSGKKIGNQLNIPGECVSGTMPVIRVIQSCVVSMQLHAYVTGTGMNALK